MPRNVREEGGEEHRVRTRHLVTVARLTGCLGKVDGLLPDGSRPDVFCIDRSRGLLFIGDAKATESPRNSETRARLENYLAWLKTHTASGRKAIFALCFGAPGDATWMPAIRAMAVRVGLIEMKHGVRRLDSEHRVAWFIYGTGA